MRQPFAFRMLSGSLHRVALALILAGTIGAGCVPAYQHQLEHARSRGDLADAAELLDRASQKAPDDPVLLRERGILAYQREDPATAGALLAQARVKMPNDPRTMLYAAAANEKAAKWNEATDLYDQAGGLAWDPAVSDAIDCQWAAVDEKRLTALVAARMESEPTGDLPAPTRILMLPFAAPQQATALNLRLGLAALLAEDWQRISEPEAVPYPELAAFLQALSISVDEPITTETRNRLCKLTGARYVVTGQLSELNDLVSVAPVLIDRGAGGDENREWRLEYRQARVATLVDLERTLVSQVASTLNVPLPTQSPEGQRLFAGESGLAVALYGEAVRLQHAGDRAGAVERLDRSLGLDPGFRPAAEERVKLGNCTAVAGDPSSLLQAYEQATAHEAGLADNRDLLEATTATNDRVGGAEGEGKDLSLNRPAASGAATFTVRVPR
jgi:tetratricopeptide (TPR) repeat protein